MARATGITQDDNPSEVDRLVACSGKLVLLDKLLPRSVPLPHQTVFLSYAQSRISEPPNVRSSPDVLCYVGVLHCFENLSLVRRKYGLTWLTPTFEVSFVACALDRLAYTLMQTSLILHDDRLQKDGHKVLIFSQFKIMLDLIEDYLIGRSFAYGRIDGSVMGSERQRQIDRCAR